MIDLLEYQNAYDIVLPAATLVSEGVRDRLIASYEDLDEDAFYLLSTKQVCLLLQDYVQPQSKLSFLNSLEQNVVFPALPAGYRPSPINFKPLYGALLQYRRNFEAVYDLLVAAVETPDVIPPATTKRGGIVKLFVEKIPFLYGHRFIEDRGLHTYASFEAFLDDFYASVEAHKKVFREAANIQQSFSGAAYFNGSFVSVKPQQSPKVDKPQQEDKSSSSPTHPTIVAEEDRDAVEVDDVLGEVFQLSEQEQPSDEALPLLQEEPIHLHADIRSDNLGQESQRCDEEAATTTALAASVAYSQRRRKAPTKSATTSLQSAALCLPGGSRRFWQPP